MPEFQRSANGDGPAIPLGVTAASRSAGLATEVAIAGCGAITAVGFGVDALRTAMLANRSGLRKCERFGNGRFQSEIVGAVFSDAKAQDDPAYELAEQALREACAEASDILKSVPPERVGFVLATTKANIEALERLSDGQACSQKARRHLQGDLLAADLAVVHGAKGPVQCVSNACVSGLFAIQQGARLIQRGDSDVAIVAGVDHLSAFVMAGFSALKALDPDGCHPFDRNRAGLSPGEAGAAIVLARKSLVQKSSDRSIQLMGWGNSNDANHITGPSRDGSGLSMAIRGTLLSANIEARDIDYINAHGTGTPFNDAMESAALRTVFGDYCPPVSGSKGMLGHTLGAAGVVETILCVLAMQEGWLPGTPGLNVAAEGMPASLLREGRPERAMKHVLKMNTGFGGVNGAILLGYG
jgi:3-oxoacyl-[acyl-carrier-protein] synthase II